jgi:hypothetical protein
MSFLALREIFFSLDTVEKILVFCVSLSIYEKGGARVFVTKGNIELQCGNQMPGIVHVLRRSDHAY